MLLDTFLHEKLIELPYQDELKAYIISVCKQHMFVENDLSNQSMTLMFIDACQRNEFSTFQSIADWSFWIAVFKHEFFKKHSIVYNELARASYMQCHFILKKKWPIFEQLATDFPKITGQTRTKLVLSSDNL